jgi:hypothetical protein
MTDTNGQYRFTAVSGMLQVKASKNGYVTTPQDVPQDATRVLIQLPAIELPADIPYASVGGSYQMTFKVSSSCHLPDDVATRTYAAGINQTSPGVHLLIVLESGDFLNNLNQFRGVVDGNGNAVMLDLFSSGNADSSNPLDYGIVEELPGNRLLQFDGTAQGSATASGISTALNGTVRLFSSGTTASPVTCQASDHELRFTRAAATSRKKF